MNRPKRRLPSSRSLTSRTSGEGSLQSQSPEPGLASVPSDGERSVVRTKRIPVLGVMQVAVMLGLAVSPLAAQAPGIPSYHQFTTRGVGLAMDYGFAGPNIPTDFDAWRITATFGLGPRMDSLPTSARLFNVGASMSRFTPRGGARTAVWGVHGGVASGLLQVGFARWDSAGATHWRSPIAIGIPLLGCFRQAASFFFWGSARLDLDHLSIPGTGGRTIARPGFVLGIHLELRNGIGVQAAADQPRLLGKKSWIFGAGVHYAFYSLPRATTPSAEKGVCFQPWPTPS